ncbi:MAG: hypothetical protein U0Q22_15235 [Acidimicrobiales bacterium]
MTGPGWNPWRSLRERERTTLLWQRLAGAGGVVEVSDDGAETIVLDPGLGRRERRAVLAHELVHLERSLLPPGSPPAVVDREEFQVQREVVRRLVPPQLLEELVHAAAADGAGDPVTVEVVADAFDVPADIARDSITLFGMRGFCD